MVFASTAFLFASMSNDYFFYLFIFFFYASSERLRNYSDGEQFVNFPPAGISLY